MLQKYLPRKGLHAKKASIVEDEILPNSVKGHLNREPSSDIQEPREMASKRNVIFVQPAPERTQETNDEKGECSKLSLTKDVSHSGTNDCKKGISTRKEFCYQTTEPHHLPDIVD